MGGYITTTATLTGAEVTELPFQSEAAAVNWWLPIELGVQEMQASGGIGDFDSVHQKVNVGDGLSGIVHIHFHEGFLPDSPAGRRPLARG